MSLPLRDGEVGGRCSVSVHELAGGGGRCGRAVATTVAALALAIGAVALAVAALALTVATAGAVAVAELGVLSVALGVGVPEVVERTTKACGSWGSP